MPIASTIRFVNGTLPSIAPIGYTLIGINDLGILSSVDENGNVTEYMNGVYPGLDSMAMMFSRNASVVTNQYLRTINGLPCNLSSYVLPWDASLRAISLSTQISSSCVAEVQKNKIPVIEASLQAVNQSIVYDNSLTIDFVAGDMIQVYLNGTAIPYPEVVLFFKRR